MQRALAISLLAACASAPTAKPTGGPRGLRASEHLDEARRHEEAAKQGWPDTHGETSSEPPVGVWVRSWDTTEHERLAEIHRGHAVALQTEFDQLCAGLTGAEVSVSPLRRFGVGGWNTTTGGIVYLSADAGAPDRLLLQMKCHRAWMMLAPSNMEDCPLDLPGLAVDARGDQSGITVSLVVRDPKLVPELQRRMMKDLEAAATLRPHR